MAEDLLHKHFLDSETYYPCWFQGGVYGELPGKLAISRHKRRRYVIVSPYKK